VGKRTGDQTLCLWICDRNNFIKFIDYFSVDIEISSGTILENLLPNKELLLENIFY